MEKAVVQYDKHRAWADVIYKNEILLKDSHPHTCIDYASGFNEALRRLSPKSFKQICNGCRKEKECPYIYDSESYCEECYKNYMFA